MRKVLITTALIALPGLAMADPPTRIGPNGCEQVYRGFWSNNGPCNYEEGSSGGDLITVRAPADPGGNGDGGDNGDPDPGDNGGDDGDPGDGDDDDGDEGEQNGGGKGKGKGKGKGPE